MCVCRLSDCVCACEGDCVCVCAGPRLAPPPCVRVNPPYGRGPAPHGAHGSGSDHGEERLAPDASAILDHAPGN